MTRFFYDWEFCEDGRMIVPLSLGMCTDSSVVSAGRCG